MSISIEEYWTLLSKQSLEIGMKYKSTINDLFWIMHIIGWCIIQKRKEAVCNVGVHSRQDKMKTQQGRKQVS